MDNIINLIKKESKHCSYQTIPNCILNKVPELKSYSFQRRLDEQRYDFINSYIDLNDKNITEIGANTGYFSIRFAQDNRSRVNIFEINPVHCDIIESYKELLDLSKESITINKIGVDEKGLINIPESDIILFFNVLHHAGEDFDSDKVKDIKEWRDYAVNYLSELAKKNEYMIYQMGYSWKGHGTKFCDRNSIIDYTTDLLNDSGWSIEEIGVLDSIFSKKYIKYQGVLKYSSLSYLMVRFLNKFRKNKLDYNFMRRPIFICKRK